MMRYTARMNKDGFYEMEVHVDDNVSTMPVEWERREHTNEKSSYSHDSSENTEIFKKGE